MSLYQIITMTDELEKRNNKTGRKVSDQEWADAEAMLASVTVNDPSVMLG